MAPTNLSAHDRDSLLRLAAEQSPTSIVVADSDGTIQYVNQKFVNLTGWAREEVVGHNPHTARSGFQSPLFDGEPWAAVHAGREWHGELLLRKKSGDLIWERASVYPLSDGDGRMTHFVAVKEDITERRRTEAALADAERKYREIVEHSQQGIYQTTLDGRILSANAAFARMLGYENVETLLSAPAGFAETLYAEPRQREEFLQRLDESGQLTQFESRLRRRDGRQIWTSESARLIRDEQGTPILCEGFIEDITDRREAERLKSDFVSFVTHQLRTPLAGIRWMLELAEETGTSDEAGSFITDARQSAERLITLVNDLLDAARLENGKFASKAEPVDLADMSRRVLGDIGARAEARHLEVSLEAPLCAYALVDPHLAQQALQNLLSNAIKYTAPGGRITVRVAACEQGLEWTVQDTGIGIAPDAQRRIFEKFYRAENGLTIDTEGTGLGLYLVQLIAQRSGGRAWCQSREGEGSTFGIMLPAAVPAETMQ